MKNIFRSSFYYSPTFPPFLVENWDTSKKKENWKAVNAL